MGPFCKKLRLSSIIWRWNYQVRLTAFAADIPLFIVRANLVDKPSGKYPCRIQPVYVVDVASAIIAALKDDGSSMGKVYELGGPEIFTMHELVSLCSMTPFFFLSSFGFPSRTCSLTPFHPPGRAYV